VTLTASEQAIAVLAASVGARPAQRAGNGQGTTVVGEVAVVGHTRLRPRFTEASAGVRAQEAPHPFEAQQPRERLGSEPWPKREIGWRRLQPISSASTPIGTAPYDRLRRQ